MDTGGHATEGPHPFGPGRGSRSMTLRTGHRPVPWLAVGVVVVVALALCGPAQAQPPPDQSPFPPTAPPLPAPTVPPTRVPAAAPPAEPVAAADPSNSALEDRVR